VTTTKSRISSSGSTMTSHGCLACQVSMTHRPSTTSMRSPVAYSSIRRRSTSVKSRSTIRFRRWALRPRSHSHQEGHSRGGRGHSSLHPRLASCGQTKPAARILHQRRTCAGSRAITHPHSQPVDEHRKTRPTLILTASRSQQRREFQLRRICSTITLSSNL